MNGGWTRSAPGLFGTVVLALVGLAAPGAAQSSVPVKVTLTVAGQTQTLRGTGECKHEAQASIYGRRALLWMAGYRGTAASGPQVSLTYWRPKDAGGPDEFQLSVSRGRKTHRINTVRGGTPAGSGQGSFRPTALGGRFEIRGTAQDGAALQATIECARFGGIVAEGG